MTEKVINTGGRFHDTSINHTVTGANEVLDDDIQKKQSVINAEQQEFNQEQEGINADTYRKNEVYNKEETNNIISRTPETDVIVMDIPAASQSDIAGWLDANTPSGIDPETGRSVRANKLYRVPGPDNTTFSEWAWDGTAYIMLDDKDYGIDDKPVRGSDNFVKSGGLSNCFSNIYPYLEGASNTLAASTGVKYYNVVDINIPANTPFRVDVSGNHDVLERNLLGTLYGITTNGTKVAIDGAFSAESYTNYYINDFDIVAVAAERGDTGVVGVGSITVKVTLPIKQFLKKNDYTRYVNIPRRITSVDNVLFLGDSIVRGYTSGGVILQNCWVNLFAQEIGFSYSNQSESGISIANGELLSQVQSVYNINKFSVVFISAGLMDKHLGYLPKAIKNSITAICDYLDSNYNGIVIWQTPQNDLDERSTSPYQNKVTAEEIRKVIYETVVSRGHGVIDGRYLPYPATRDTDISGIISDDNVHPTELGYTVYARYMCDILGEKVVNKLGENIPLKTGGYYNNEKEVVPLETWKHADISIDECSGIYVESQCNGENAYSYLLDENDNVIISWNNEIIRQFISKDIFNGASRLLISCRDEYSSIVKKYYTVKDVLDEYNNSLKNTINSFIGKDWKLNSKMSIDLNGNIVGNNVPSNNTAISFNLSNRNVWWIRAHLNNNGKELVNAGLVVSENTIGKSFRMMKAAFRAAGTAANTTIDFYSHPRSSFEEYKRIVESSTLKGDECVLSMAISGCVCTGYLNDQFMGYQKFKRIEGESRTMFGGILMSNDVKASDISFGVRPTPYAHFSLDDIGRIMRTISLSNLTSIFDNEMFAFLKNMHEKYGLCITLNLFYSIVVDGNTWTLASFPNTFYNELQNNSSWLKFSFHGGDESIRYNEESNNSAAIAACNNTLNEISRFAGEASIDYMMRPTFFSGNKSLWVFLRDAGNLFGCLTADDARENNCGLTSIERACIYTSSDYIDFERGLYYIKSAPRFDTQTTAQVKAMVLSDVSDTCRNKVFEYFTHAEDTISEKDRLSIEEALKILVANQVRMDFPQNNLPQ